MVNKIISNRIKLHLNINIKPYQSAFISDKLINDNVILAYETFHTFVCFTNRLKLHLNISIKFYQSAFILDKLITGNVIFAYETFHNLL